ncbi:hypothetical protein JCM10908_001108 [Rhodotorula pacifica]|uniref:uncharacterized protein n=1 Tax=Rhodotorula pacifica TaxID=1495444 RepID=UPI0031807ED6
MANSQAAIDFPLLQLVSNARATYGLRHQDYARYKSHCVAKVHHLRKAAGLSQKAGKFRKYEKKELTADKVTGAKALQILLFDAERCWAQAQVLKEEHADDATSRNKHHIAKRLVKAASQAKELVDILQHEDLSRRLSESQTTQAHAYALVMTGTAAFERGKHEEGLKVLSVAHEVLAKLASTAGSATEEALANEMLDEIEPMLRFCAYRLGKDTSTGVSTIAAQVAAGEITSLVPSWDDLQRQLDEAGQTSKKETVNITWRGQEIPIRNAELVTAAAKVQGVLATLKTDEAASKKGSTVAEGKKPAASKKDILGSRRMGTFDKALLVLSEAEATAAQLVEDNKIAMSKGNTARFEASSRALSAFHAYVQYHLLAVRVKRDLLLVASTEAKLAARELKIRHAEEAYTARTERRDPAVAEGKIKRLRTKVYPGLIKVFDTILLSFESMRDMEAVEQDDELATLVDARIAYTRAVRCQYLSRGYALASQFPSSLTLDARAKLYARQARATAAALSESFDLPTSAADDETEHDFVADRLPLDPPSLDALDSDLDADYQRISRDWFTATGGQVGADEEGLDIARLSLAEGSHQAPAPSKKVPFFDVAYNYVTEFDMNALAVKAGLRIPTAPTPSAPIATSSAKTAQVAEPAQDDATAPAALEEEQPTPTKRGWGFGLFGRR